MSGENPTTPASAAPAQPAPAAPAAAAPAQPAAAAPTPILGADPTKAPATDPAKPADPAAAKPVVPEKYELKAPQGQTLDAATLEAFTPIFKKHGLSNEAAQELADVQFKLSADAVKSAEKQVGDQIAQETAAWAKASREDKEFGGANFDANAKIANKALAAFGTPELRNLLVESGYANHPAFVRLFWTIGQKLAESSAPTHGAPPAAASAPERVLYPTMNKH
jgi:hypothetical protein